MPTYKRKHVIMLFVYFAIGLLAPSPVSLKAQDISNAPEITVKLAWDHYIRTPGWTELQVILNNEFRDWEGQLRIIDNNNEITYHKHLVLPAHSQKQYRIPLFLDEISNIQVQLQNTDGNIIHAQRLKLSRIYDMRVCAIANMNGTFPNDNFNTCSYTLILQDLKRLPETAMAWDTLDVLIINGLSTQELTTKQKNALLTWVSAGGYLVLSGGPTLRQTIAHLPQALKIAELGQIETITFPSEFEGLKQAPAIPLIPNNIQDDVLLSTSETMLALAHPLDQGSVILLGWDIAQQTNLSWLEKLWANSISPATASSLTGNRLFSTATPAPYTLLEIPIAVLPMLWPGLLLFPLYLILMGPGTWFIVRRLKRPVLTWILLPIWIIFTLIVMALGLSGAFSKTFPIIHEAAMIYVSGQNLPARVVQGTAIYAPRTQRLTWSTPDGAPRPLVGSYLFDSWYGGGTAYPVNVQYTDQLTNIEVPHPFGIHTWGTEGLYTPPALQSNLFINTQQDNPHISGSLQSTHTLRDVRLLLRQGNYQLTLTDHLTAAHEIQVNEVLTTTDYEPRWYDNACRGLNGEMGYVPPGRPGPVTIAKPPMNLDDSAQIWCYIIGIIDEVPFPAQYNGGTHLQESCVIYTVPCPSQEEGILKTPLRGDPAQIENGWMDEQGVVHIGSPSANLVYVLPEFLNIREVHKLTLSIDPAPWSRLSNPARTPTSQPTEDSYELGIDIQHIALWDWEQQAWIEQPLEQFTPQLSLTGTNAKRFFSREEGLRLNITPKTQDGIYISITPIIEGTW